LRKTKSKIKRKKPKFKTQRDKESYEMQNKREWMDVRKVTVPKTQIKNEGWTENAAHAEWRRQMPQHRMKAYQKLHSNGKKNPKKQKKKNSDKKEQNEM